MNSKNSKGNSKFSFTALGLVFGTGIGIVLCLIITSNVLWATVGTAIGLIIGAIIDSNRKRK